MPVAAVPALVADVAEMYASLPAVLGPRAASVAFAERWTALRGGYMTIGREQRIFQAIEVRLPDPLATGHLRQAGPADAAVVARWLGAFFSETGLPAGDIAAATARLIDGQGLHLWEDGDPRCMVAAVGPTPHGIRIGYVYTPPEHRNRGYASAATARLTQDLLAAGRAYCFLYTDLANPTSNALYRRVGYEPVCDVVDVDFVEGAV